MGGPWARPACFACWRSPTPGMAGCPGRACSSRPSAWLTRDLPSAPAWRACWRRRRPWPRTRRRGRTSSRPMARQRASARGCATRHWRRCSARSPAMAPTRSTRAISHRPSSPRCASTRPTLGSSRSRTWPAIDLWSASRCASRIARRGSADFRRRVPARWPWRRSSACSRGTTSRRSRRRASATGAGRFGPRPSTCTRRPPGWPTPIATPTSATLRSSPFPCSRCSRPPTSRGGPHSSAPGRCARRSRACRRGCRAPSSPGVMSSLLRYSKTAVWTGLASTMPA